MPASAAAVLSAASILLAGCSSAPPEPPRIKPPAEVMPMVGQGNAPGDVLYGWTQIASGRPLARALIAGWDQPCPEIQVDDAPAVRMTARPDAVPGSHPVTLCEHPLALPDGRPASRAQLADRLLPLPGVVPERIAVIGDTGAEWPLAQIARTVARRQSPTLVVYVGENGCGGSDDWQSRREAFFQPADELLQVAPWLVSRSCPILAPAAETFESALPVSAMVRAYREIQASAGTPGYLMLVRNPDGPTWQATFSSPDGDETRSCRLAGSSFDCGAPDGDPGVP